MQNTKNSTAFIDAEVYSSFILRNLLDGLLPGTFYRNVSDFGSGNTLHIKTVGTVTIQDVGENIPADYSPIESGEIKMYITDYLGDAWYVTDDLREDGSQIPALMAARATESTRAIQETFESRFLAYAAMSQTDGSPNTINRQPHRLVIDSIDGQDIINAAIQMKLSFDKANVPAAGRIWVVDPVTEARINKMITITSDTSDFAARYLTTGFAQNSRYLTNLFGWNIITSNRLPVGTFSDGTTSVRDGVVNIFMSILDDQTKPMMAAWRRMPRVEGERNKDLRRDEFVSSCRFGFGAQRQDTLGTLIVPSVGVNF